jgi:hypothetical protein
VLLSYQCWLEDTTISLLEDRKKNNTRYWLTNQWGNQGVGNSRNKKTAPEGGKNRIIISGDSHSRDCPSKVEFDLDNASEVQGVIMPGAAIVTITKTAKDITNFTKKDVVVVWEGKWM